MAGKEAGMVTVAGTGTIWVAPEGTTMPLLLAAPASPFVDIGYTSEDGVKFSVSREQEAIAAWQSADPVRVLITSEPKTLAFELLEFDRPSIELALRGGTWSGTPPTIVYTPPAAGASDVRAMVIDAVDGAYQFRFMFPRVQLSGDVEFSLVRTDAIRLPLEFSVLASTPGWTWVGNGPQFAVPALGDAGAPDEAEPAGKSK